MKRLVRWADVMMNNFRGPEIMNKLGLGYDVVKEWNPRIIYVSNSGFGPTGEWAERASFDGMAQSFTGITTVQGGGPSHEPRLVEWAFSDVVGAMNFYQSTLAALVAREMTGKGQLVETSQTGATVYFQRPYIVKAMQQGAQRDDGKPPGQQFS